MLTLVEKIACDLQNQRKFGLGLLSALLLFRRLSLGLNAAVVGNAALNVDMGPTLNFVLVAQDGFCYLELRYQGCLRRLRGFKSSVEGSESGVGVLVVFEPTQGL